MNRDILRQLLTIFAFLMTLVGNGLANSLPLNGQTTGEISDRFQIYFVPAGYVFSIWGLIYLGLATYAVYQVLPSQRENDRLRRISFPFVASCFANLTWLVLWHYEVFILSLVAMVGLLLSLISIYQRLEIGRSFAPAAEKVWVHLPFSIYLGWITVATISNATTVLDFLGWDGWGIPPEIWAVIMLLVATAIASIVSLQRGDIAYMLVVMWAFAGIAAKHANTPVVRQTAWLTTVIAGVMLLAGGVIHRKRKMQETS